MGPGEQFRPLPTSSFDPLRPRHRAGRMVGESREGGRARTRELHRPRRENPGLHQGWARKRPDLLEWRAALHPFAPAPRAHSSLPRFLFHAPKSAVLGTRCLVRRLPTTRVGGPTLRRRGGWRGPEVHKKRFRLLPRKFNATWKTASCPAACGRGGQRKRAQYVAGTHDVA